MNNLLFQSGDKVLFIGDSITDCGRRNEHAPLGHGYVRKITELITAKYPERDITYVNKGIGGDIVEGLGKSVGHRCDCRSTEMALGENWY